MQAKITVGILMFFICLSFSNFTFAQSGPVTGEERTRLEAELRQLEEESAKIQKELEGKKGQRKSLEGELSIINLKISESRKRTRGRIFS